MSLFDKSEKFFSALKIILGVEIVFVSFCFSSSIEAVCCTRCHRHILIIENNNPVIILIKILINNNNKLCILSFIK